MKRKILQIISAKVNSGHKMRINMEERISPGENKGILIQLKFEQELDRINTDSNSKEGLPLSSLQAQGVKYV